MSHLRPQVSVRRSLSQDLRHTLEKAPHLNYRVSYSVISPKGKYLPLASVVGKNLSFSLPWTGFALSLLTLHCLFIFFSLYLIVACWRSFLLVSMLPLSLTNQLLLWHFESFCSSFSHTPQHSLFSNSSCLLVLKIPVFASPSTWLSHQSFLYPPLSGWGSIRHGCLEQYLALQMNVYQALVQKYFHFSCFIRHTLSEFAFSAVPSHPDPSARPSSLSNISRYSSAS